jgi:ribonuclease P protein component
MNKRLRLRRTEDFERLRREGRVYRHPYLILSLAPNGLQHNRYGFVTGKKLGKAVMRNQVRRRLREIVRGFHPELAQGYDIVVIARPEAVRQSFAVLQQAIRHTLERAAVAGETSRGIPET